MHPLTIEMTQYIDRVE